MTRTTGTANTTMEKFGWPGSLVADYDHWVVLLRPEQVTLGALVLAAKSDVTAFSELPAEAFSELGTVTRHIEATLSRLWSYNKINYVMLMMVDPHVHFHVLPRYDTPRDFAGHSFVDRGWPKTPDLGAPNAVDAAGLDAITHALRDSWPVIS
ncbi:MAG: HIT family protein [Alphaproteobacteria bacterium]|nr:MAG: HIT family protein [Alphaproteobacteria bacterium]